MSSDDGNFRAVTRHRIKENLPPTELKFPIAGMDEVSDNGSSGTRSSMPDLDDDNESECATDLPPEVPRSPAGGNSTPESRSDDSGGEESDENPVTVEEDS